MDEKDRVQRKEAVIDKGSASEVHKKGFWSLIFAGDFHSAMRSAFTEVIVPKIAETVTESINVAANSMVYGDDFYPQSSKSSSSGGRNYNIISTNNASRAKTRQEVKNTDHRNVRDILFSDVRDAMRVRDELINTAKEYPIVTVTDFYDFANMGEKTVPADEQYGWDNLSNRDIEIVSVRYFNEETRRYEKRYYIDLPKAMSID